jgi:hypothetical protein
MRGAGYGMRGRRRDGMEGDMGRQMRQTQGDVRRQRRARGRQTRWGGSESRIKLLSSFHSF